MKRHTRPSAEQNTFALIPVAADVDLVRFETNLLQIGFFSAQDPRKKRDSSRSFEQSVTRNGQKVRVTAKFNSSEELGLPSTADRDKFLALLKIISEERARVGAIQNPIRFSGYRLLKELGLTDAGQNYEEISNWGRRMATTTITSERVVYMSAKKRYAEKTIHVFRSFSKVGESNHDGSDRTEAYEVQLEDWLLENLNHGYVVPEDFSAYKKLTRPTAKGIFGNLHLWFHASQGRAVEKDYNELCHFLNIKAYPHASKIKETMGQSLDELVTVGYLSAWQLQPMTTKLGFKFVLLPGQMLLRVISLSQRKQLTDTVGEFATDFSDAQRTAIDALIENGVSAAKAKSLVCQFDPELMLEQIEYAQSQIEVDAKGRKKITNPAGFVIYCIESGLAVPGDFQTGRKRRERMILQDQQERQREEQFRMQEKYLDWKDKLVNAELDARYKGDELKRKLREIISQRQRSDDHFRRLNGLPLENLALAFLRKDVVSEMSLPTFEEWLQEQTQGHLF